MIKRFLKKQVSTRDKKRLVENVFSLSAVQMVNYLLPLITFPYLIRVLGFERFGLIAFAQAVIQYLVIFTDYGFYLSATRAVSVNRSDPKKLSSIVAAVFVVKTILLALSAAVLVGMLLFIPKFRADWLLYVFCFGLVLENFLFPVWFFQGIENMKYIALRNGITKLFFTVMIFVFVHRPEHYLYVPLINSLGMVVSGGIGLVAVFTAFKVSLVVPTFGDIWEQVTEGWRIFVSKLAISLYTTTNTVILGLFMSNIVVGYYAAGEKIIRMVTSMFEPLFKAAYPYVAKRAATDHNAAVGQLKKVFLVSFWGSVVVFVVFLLFSGDIVRLILGAQGAGSLPIVRVLSPLLLIIPASYVLANLGLLSFRLDAQFLGIYLGGGLVNAVFLWLFIGGLSLGGVGAACASVLTEGVLLASMWQVLRSNKVRLL
jgi:PST family polysaccharide transporter